MHCHCISSFLFFPLSPISPLKFIILPCKCTKNRYFVRLFLFILKRLRPGHLLVITQFHQNTRVLIWFSFNTDETIIFGWKITAVFIDSETIEAEHWDARSNVIHLTSFLTTSLFLISSFLSLYSGSHLLIEQKTMELSVSLKNMIHRTRLVFSA